MRDRGNRFKQMSRLDMKGSIDGFFGLFFFGWAGPDFGEGVNGVAADFFVALGKEIAKPRADSFGITLSSRPERSQASARAAPPLYAISAASLKWFTYSGVSVCIAQMFIYMAYAIAPISVVTPILQLHHVLRVVFARLLNPHHEAFGGRMILGTALSLLGAVILSLDTELVLSILPLPGPVASIARWQWP